MARYFKKLSLFHAVAFGAALTLGASPSDARGKGHGHGGGGCKTVLGPWSSVPVPPPECTSPVGNCTLGELGGSLAGGTYEFTMNTLQSVPEPEAGFVVFFTGISEITTRQGHVYRAVDTGALNASPPGDVGSGEFSTLLSVVDGGSGYLHIRGTLDLATGEASGTFIGKLCRE